MCGGLRLDHPIARRLVEALPPIVHMRPTRSGRSAGPFAAIDLLADEMEHGGTGSGAVISRLCDVVVLQAIRSWVSSEEAAGSRWLAAMSDPQIGPALAALHRYPEQRWAVSSLAAHALMSRSAFAARFTEVVGQSAMRYLTDLRMQLALDLLRRTDRSVSEVAAAVGYDSEASFSRVFKRVMGTSPRAASRPERSGAERAFVAVAASP